MEYLIQLHVWQINTYSFPAMLRKTLAFHVFCIIYDGHSSDPRIHNPILRIARSRVCILLNERKFSELFSFRRIHLWVTEKKYMLFRNCNGKNYYDEINHYVYTLNAFQMEVIKPFKDCVSKCDKMSYFKHFSMNNAISIYSFCQSNN